ncbi:MAG: glycosyltransferase [Rhodospirillales bacterium]|nr:glycosyltransferase [Rhodospirillales bacterium]
MHIAMLLNDLSGGGVERTMLTLAGGFLSRGHGVDLVLARYHGPLAGEVPQGARIIVPDARGGMVSRLAIARADPAGLGLLARPVLMAKRKRQGEVMPRLPGLVSYLRRERPDVLVSAKYRPNLCAVWARRLARVPTRLVLTERTSVSEQFPKTRPTAHHRSVPVLMHRYYPCADQIVTVSRDLADDLAAFAAIPRERILPIYNPVVDDRLARAAAERPDHPWFRLGDVPIVLGVGRLERRKGFATLIRAFARIRRLRPLRLVILGGGKTAKGEAADRAVLDALIRDLGVETDVSLPGFKLNPYAYMARASVFVLASDYEGLPGVLIQAMACGCPVVSTDWATTRPWPRPSPMFSTRRRRQPTCGAVPATSASMRRSATIWRCSRPSAPTTRAGRRPRKRDMSEAGRCRGALPRLANWRTRREGERLPPHRRRGGGGAAQAQGAALLP